MSIKTKSVVKKPLPPVKYLLSRLEINEASPSGLVWKSGRRSGQRAGYLLRRSGWMLYIGGNYHYCHRVIWAMAHGFEPPVDCCIDHINRNCQDNRVSNLRIASKAENCRNGSVQKKTRSGIRGVTRDGSRWRARITLNGTQKFLGNFTSIAMAQEAYRKASVALHGQFSPHQ